MATEKGDAQDSMLQPLLPAVPEKSGATAAPASCSDVDAGRAEAKSTLPHFFRNFFARAVIATCAWLWVLHHTPIAPVRAHARHALSPDLVDGCRALLAPGNTTYLSRLSHLTAALSSTSLGSVTYIAEPGPSALYYLGAFGRADWGLSERPFLVAVTPGADGAPNITLLTPAFESLRAHLVDIPAQLAPHVTWVQWAESDDPYGTLLEHLGDTGALILDAHVRSFIGVGLHRYVGPVDGLADVEGEVRDRIALIRERKDEREIGLMRCANQMTLHAIRETRRQMRFGISESQTRAIMAKEMEKAGLSGGEALILFGENAALPHGSGTDRKLGKRDLALIDAMGSWGGYTSDISRTFALPGSDIPDEHIAIWETVRRAQAAPARLLAAHNASAPPLLADLDAEARRIVATDLGLASSAPHVDYSVFTHRLGHGVGLEVHEGPYVVQGPLGARPVVAGYVFSQEPGVYMPAARGDDPASGVGVRLEDCFVVREGADGRLGGEWLTGPVQRWGDV